MEGAWVPESLCRRQSPGHLGEITWCEKYILTVLYHQDFSLSVTAAGISLNSAKCLSDFVFRHIFLMFFLFFFYFIYHCYVFGEERISRGISL